MYPFEYFNARSIAEASDLLGECADARALAGGQSLLPTMRLRLAAPPRIVDLGGIAGLATIDVTPQEVIVGAMTRHAEMAVSAEIARHAPALRDLASGIADQQVRNLGTLGGSLANNDPAACYPAAVLALDATVSTNRRRMRCAEFFRGLYETSLEPGELITAVSFPRAVAGAYVKFRQPASRFALVGVFVAVHADHVRVAVTGAGAAGVFRATALESALSASMTRESLAGIRVDPASLSSDMHASAEYRAHLITVLTGEAVRKIQSRSIQ
ncbi:MAG: xanthine dehydrogenase family protein subunit M [Gammaproteobacteria bacterium]